MINTISIEEHVIYLDRVFGLQDFFYIYYISKCTEAKFPLEHSINNKLF